MWDVSDVHNDIKEHLGVVGLSLSRRIRGRNVYQQTWGNVNERTSLLPDAAVPAAKSIPTASVSGYQVAEEVGQSVTESNECTVAIDDLTSDVPSSSNVVHT